MNPLEMIVIAIGVYAAIGVGIGVPFAISGAPHIDDAVGRSPKRVRAVIAIGAVGLWPIVLVRWLGVGRQKHDALEVSDVAEDQS